MKIELVDDLALNDIKTLRYARFRDNRGYFSETYRKSDMEEYLGSEIVQMNESFSNEKVLRGLHFQWNPHMGKLVRTIKGHMVDLVLDIRKGSSTYGKIIGHDMPARDSGGRGTWIWVPPGFAHGNMFLEETTIEYLCTGEYSPGCEAGISPYDKDLDWSLCEPSLRKLIQRIMESGEAIISEKDMGGMTLKQWEENENSDQFIYGEC